jgi:hypothetical protein
MVKLVNRARMTTPSTGTGGITLGVAINGFQSFVAAGVGNGDAVRYLLEEGEAWELGIGTYSASGPTLTRSVTESSASGNLISLTGTATVSLVLTAADLDSKAALTDPRLTDAREWTAVTVTQSEAEAGIATTRRAFTAQRIRQAILAWWAGSPEKTKLDGIAGGAQVNVPTNLGITGTGNSRTITSSTGTNVTIPVATTSTAGLMATGDKSKLDGIAAGAQVNSITSVAGKTGAVTLSLDDLTDADISSATFGDVLFHNGVAWVNVDPGTAGLVSATDTRLGNAREWTASTVALAEAEAGTDTTRRAWTAQRIRQAILAWWAGSADKTKLDGIAAGAQVNTVTSVAAKTGAVTLSAADVGAAAGSHDHGSLTSDGRIGSSANLVVITGTSGALTAKAAGTTSQYLRGDGNWATPPNTTYAEISTAEIDAGTASTLRSISGRRIGYALGKKADLTHGHVAATAVADGFMSASDKTKLDGIAAGAQVNVATNLGVLDGTTGGPTVTSSTGTNATLPAASATASGVVITGAQTFAGTKTFTATISGSISGNAGSATALQTARSINGVSFNGTADITLPTVNTSGNQTIAGVKTFGTAIAISGTSNAAGHFYAGTTNPGNTTRLNYDGNLHVNALTAVGDITAFSDARFKTDIQTIGGALDKLSLIHGVTFRRTGDETQTQTRYVGVLAQEVEAVMPEAVHTDAEGYKAVAYGNMVALLIEAIKELTARLEKLDADFRITGQRLR